MVNLKKNKFGGRKNEEGGRTTKNTKKKEKQGRDLHSKKGSRKKIENIERSQKRVSDNNQHKKNNKGKNKKGGQYVYFPERNIIQFLPYSYKNTISSTNKIYNQIYNGNQAGGNILPQTCSNFTPNMLNREFNCKQPFWNENCT